MSSGNRNCPKIPNRIPYRHRFFRFSMSVRILCLVEINIDAISCSSKSSCIKRRTHLPITDKFSISKSLIFGSDIFILSLNMTAYRLSRRSVLYLLISASSISGIMFTSDGCTFRKVFHSLSMKRLCDIDRLMVIRRKRSSLFTPFGKMLHRNNSRNGSLNNNSPEYPARQW